MRNITRKKTTIKQVSTFLICLTIAGIGFDKFEVIPIPRVGFTDIISLFLVIITLADISAKRSIKRKTAIVIFVASIFGGSVIISGDSIYKNLLAVLPVLKGVSLLIITLYWTRRTEQLVYYLYSFLVAGILVTVTAVNPGLLGLSLESVRVAPISRLTDVGIGLEIKRTPGVAQSHGYFGSIICSSFFSTIGLYLLSKNSKSSVKYIYVFIGVVIAFTGLIVSQSRSMLAAILFSCSVFALLGLHNKDVGYFVWLVAGSMAFLIGSFLVNHFSDILMSNINSVYKRASILRLTLSKINENFLVGYGLSTQYVIEIINSVSHNTFIGIWARFGLFALISYVSIMFYSIYSVIHTMGVTTTLSILSAILLSILSAHIIEMMFYNGFGNPIHYILYGIMLSTNKI